MNQYLFLKEILCRLHCVNSGLVEDEQPAHIVTVWTPDPVHPRGHHLARHPTIRGSRDADVGGDIQMSQHPWWYGCSPTLLKDNV